MLLQQEQLLFVCTLLLTHDTFTDYIVNKMINRNNIQLLLYVVTLQRYDSFFNLQIFWEKFFKLPVRLAQKNKSALFSGCALAGC